MPKNMLEFFSPPNGDFVSNPSLDLIKDLILTSGPEYWNAGAGQGSLSRYGNAKKCKLLVTFQEQHGFCLDYVDPRGDYFVSIGSDEFQKTVVVYIGGNPVLFPLAFFLPRRVAWSAVESFCKTGRRSRKIKWARSEDLQWDYSIPEDKE